jgi:tetratricopeptide (TPR) repeat protein
MDPVMIGAVLVAIAGGAGGTLGSQLCAAISALVRRPSLRAHATTGITAVLPIGSAELSAWEQAPADERQAVALAEVLVTRAAADAEFQEALEAWWERASQFRVSGGDVTNTISGGTQYAPVLQGRDFSGIAFNTAPPVPPPAQDPEERSRRTGEPAGDSGHVAGTGNQLSGTVAGPVVQAGVIYGGVHMHEATTPRAVPCQLPATSRGFVNRKRQLAAMTRRLNPAPHGSSNVLISVIDGAAGIGKTALAVRWAHSVRDRFPDGQLYVNLRGFDPAGRPLTSAEALQVLLEGLGVSPDRVPARVESRVALYRSLLSDRRVLVVLDNAVDTPQVELLLPGAASCATVVTSRNRLDGLAVHYRSDRIALDLLTSAESRQLMVRHLGANRLAAEPHAVSELILRCGHLPLALSIMAARAAFNPDFPLRLLAEELRDERRQLDALDVGDLATNIRAVFSWSYRQLAPGIARVFRLLGLHPGPDIGLFAAAAIAGMSEQHARQCLEALARAHLLEQHMPYRYRFHDLLRAYATEQAGEDEPSPEQQLALRRVLDSYLHSANNASRQLNVHRPPIPVDPPQPDVVVRQFNSYAEAMRWYQEEYQNLMAAIEWTAAHNFDEYAWRLALTFWQYLYLCGRWHEVIATHETALAAALRDDNRPAMAAIHANLGVARTQLGDYEAGAAHFREALALYRDAADLYGEGNALDSLAFVHVQSGDFREAISYCEQALAIYRRTGSRDGEGRALDSLGVAYAGLGQYEQGIGYGMQALELHRQAADRLGQAHALRSLGRCYVQTGHYHQAIAQFRQALILCRDVGDRHDEASNLHDLGMVLHTIGEDDEARKQLEQALAILAEIRHPTAVAVQADLAALPSLPDPAE